MKMIDRRIAKLEDLCRKHKSVAADEHHQAAMRAATATLSIEELRLLAYMTESEIEAICEGDRSELDSKAVELARIFTKIEAFVRPIKLVAFR